MSDTPRGKDESLERVQRNVAAMEALAEKAGIYHRGWRFFPPYACGRCGEPISAYQFAFARACGACDLGNTRARFSIFEHRWFVLGKAVLENKDDSHLIDVELIPARRRNEFAIIAPRPPLLPKPRLPFKPYRAKIERPRRLRGAH